MGKKKSSGRPTGKRLPPNLVAAAVEVAGGVTAVARLCEVTRQTVYDWIEAWRVERLRDALTLSEASGIPVEKFAGRNLPGKRSSLPRKSKGRARTQNPQAEAAPKDSNRSAPPSRNVEAAAPESLPVSANASAPAIGFQASLRPHRKSSRAARQD